MSSTSTSRDVAPYTDLPPDTVPYPNLPRDIAKIWTLLQPEANREFTFEA